jgi:hypothetical protein
MVLHPAIQKYIRREGVGYDYLSLLVVGQTDRIELFDDLLRRVVLLYLAFSVETHHVASVDLASELEELNKALLFCLCESTGSHSNHKVDVSVVVVLFIVLCVGVSKRCVNSV